MAHVPGRYISVKKNPKSSRDLLRRHLREEGKTIVHDLASWWGIHPNSAYRRMYDTHRPFTPTFIEQAITGLQLDAFDAQELRLLAAREAGWLIDPNLDIPQ